MNCEQVEELLSAYLDNSLAAGEKGTEAAQWLRQAITAHLATCTHCSVLLADLRRFDSLIAHLPRVSPGPGLRDRIFSSPEYHALTGTYNSGSDEIETRPFGRVQRAPGERLPAGRPQLVALPGGRPGSSVRGRAPSNPRGSFRRRSSWGLRAMQGAIAAALLLTIGVGGLIGWNLWLQTHSALTNSGAITPPAGIDQRTPLSAGLRYVYQSGAALMSAPADGGTPAQRLTPSSVAVAANWVISPPLPGRAAGDMIAYIDVQRAQVHTIRSDGQSDTTLPQSLIKAGITPASVWETGVGEDILHSLTWSKDGSMLAFVADPAGADSASLYIFATGTDTLTKVPLPIRGNVSMPVWSPDGVRIAFAVTHGGQASIFDYNTQDNGLLALANSVASQAYPGDTLLALDWSPNTGDPAITWSVGNMNAVHSLWIHRVGPGATTAPQLLLSGLYAQAIYSRSGHAGIGSWLLESVAAGHPANLLRLDVTPGAFPQQLTSGQHAGFAAWSPDGTQVDYLDGLSDNVGTLHVVNVLTGSDMTLARAVTNEPLPAWSGDGEQLAYSTGTQVVVVHLQQGRKAEHLQPHGMASALLWSATNSSQLVAAFNDGQQGTYLFDTRHNTAHQVDQRGISGSVLWTEVP